MSINKIVSIGDLLLTTDSYHALYNKYQWHGYTNFIIGEVTDVATYTFDLHAIDVHSSKMNFSNTGLVSGNLQGSPYLLKLYVK